MLEDILYPEKRKRLKMSSNSTTNRYDKYKDSGIEWIGEIPDSWSIIPHKHIMTKVKQICEKYNNEDIISLTMKGVIKRDLSNPTGKMPLSFDGYQKVTPGNLLLCLFDIDVTPRCVGLIKDSGLTSPAYSQFKFLDYDSPSFYTYLLTMIDDDKCFLHLSKNLRNSLTEENFGAILTIRPTISEQEAIAGYLDQKCGAIDETIEKQKSVIEKLKEYKQSIITQAVTKGLDKSAPMKDSGIEWIGQIPQHWEIRKLKTIGDYRNGLTYSPEDICEENNGTLVLRSSNIKNGKISFNDNVYVSSNIPEILKVKKDDILICSRNGSKDLIGKNALIPEELNASFGAFTMIFRCKCPQYMYNILNSHIFSYYLGSFFTSTINQLTGKNFGNMDIVYCPNINEQNQINAYLDKKCSEIDKNIEDKEKLIEKLVEYKKSLIYECVTGKRKVVA